MLLWNLKNIKNPVSVFFLAFKVQIWTKYEIFKLFW